MLMRSFRVFFLACLSFLLLACATTPAPDTDREHLNVAMRFLRGIDAGALAMHGLQTALEKESKRNPAMADLIAKATQMVSKQDIETLAGRIYMNHLSKEELTDLANFVETPVGGRFFKTIMTERVIKKSNVPSSEIMKQFNSDELAQIMKFSLSDSAAALKREVPQINKELATAAKELGKLKMKEYLDSLPD